MVPDLAQVLGDAAGTHVLDKRGVVGEEMVCDVVCAFPHVPAQTQFLGLDPVVGDALVGASVLRRRAVSDLARRGTSAAGFVGDGGHGGCEGGDEAGSVLGSLQVLLQKSPVVPL